MKLPVLFTLLFVSLLTNAHANQIIGKVAKLRGKVSILELGSKEGVSAILGQAVSKEASILTSDKSFIQIVMTDKSQINLGPNSKIVLDQVKAEKVGVVSLLKGVIRAQVIKEADQSGKAGKLGKDKLYIKSRTAALGIRGTDFQASYNPENKITNLITFTGKVMMVKTKAQTESEDLKEALESNKAVMVESGKFSSVTDSLINVTEPVKISPVQFTALKLNNEMLTTNNNVSIEATPEFKAELKKTYEQYAEISKLEIENKNLGGRVFNSDIQVLRPVSGGVVDIVTGIYVPPSSEQTNYLKDYNIYEFKSEKGVVSDAGNYLPPVGIVLDAKKGFVSDTQNSNQEVKAEITRLNNDISGQISKPVKVIKPNKDDLGGKGEDAYDKYFIKE